MDERAAAEHDVVFYDGTCGLCHRAVRAWLARDRRGLLRFAPLQGETFAELVPADQRAELPDSIVVRAADGRLLTGSDATVHLLRRLGGAWGLAGALLRLVPRPLRDLAYGAVARHRKRFFGSTDALCPLLPPEQRARFLP